MELILLEDIEKLGKMGAIVNVKDGFGRNFLLPSEKALRATDANKEKFETQRKEHEAANKAKKDAALKLHKTIDSKDYILIRQSGESGHLYGSVSSKDICAILKDEHDFVATRNMVSITHPIKILGLHKIYVTLHSDIRATLILNVARSEDEAKLQKKAGIIVGVEIEEIEVPAPKAKRTAGKTEETTEASSKTESSINEPVTAADA